MAWSIQTSQGFESRKIWPFVIPYTLGRGLDIGCGLETCLPSMIGVDKERGAAAIVGEATDLDIVGDESLDYIFSSHLLEHIHPDEVMNTLDLWASKIKVGGYLILYVPNANDYPKVGEEGANPDHKWNIFIGDIHNSIKRLEGGWTLVEHEERSAYNEYSIFSVCRKGKHKNLAYQVWERNPDGKKRCLVFRLGAIGDCLVAASPCKALQQQGYHVTMMTSRVGGQIFENNPHIDEIIVAEKEQFPPGANIEFFERMKERYDKIVNLDRSLENLLLAREENYSFDYPLEARRMLMGQFNYYETAHAIADVRHTEPQRGFFPTDAEIEHAKEGRKSVVGPIVMWVFAGSSFFKVYPWVNVVAEWLSKDGVSVVLSGAGNPSLILEHAIINTMHDNGAETNMMYPRVNKWTLRESMTFAREVDCLIGPETGIMHSAAFETVPKVIYLSHSSAFNLVEHWWHTTVVQPLGCDCYPCHQIHVAKDTCNFDEEAGVARCASSISPERLYKAIKYRLDGGEP